tara:strand:+ start:4319 stop:4552 length:234 start_codon:yes stop_codon:yes gene_type:complete
MKITKEQLKQIIKEELDATQETNLTEGFQESYNWFMSLPPDHQAMVLKSIGYLTGISSLTAAMMMGIEAISNRMKNK